MFAVKPENFLHPKDGILRRLSQHYFIWNNTWGRAYSNSKNLLLIYKNSLQIRLLKIINKNKFTVDKSPMSIDQIFPYESLFYHYEDSLQTAYIIGWEQKRQQISYEGSGSLN